MADRMMQVQNVRARGKLKRLSSKVACITIPSLPPLSEEDEAAKNISSMDISPAKPQVHIFETDPARLELAKAEEAKRRRKCNETLLALEKIQDRIDYTITEYEGPAGEEIDTNASLETVQDSNQLFRLLADPQMRSKYRQKLTVFIVGYEEKHDELESVLGQLHEFFEETKSGGTANLLEQVAEEELDLDKATKELGGALETAQNAVKKLVGIKKEMNHLVSIVSAYPDTSKGRKNMEKALMKAQEEVDMFSKNLDEVQTTLKASTEKCSQLQVQLDAKNQECTKFHKSADQVELLQVGNEKLKRELEAAEKSLEESREVLSEAKKSQEAAEKSTGVKKVVELETVLAMEKSKYEKLVAEMEVLVEGHANEMEALKAEHEAESNEVRGRFEDQLKSLMEEDVFGEGDTEEGEVTDGEEVNLEETSPESSTTEPAEMGSEKKDASPTAGSASILRDTDHEDEIKRLRGELEAKEKLMQSQVAKSRKMVALLQSELADVNSKKASEKERLETEVRDLKEKLSEAQHLNEELEEELASLQAEKAALLEAVQQKETELQQVTEELQASFERVSSHQHSAATPIPRATEILSLRSSFQSPMQSVSTVPMVALEEGYGHPDSQVLMSSADLIGDDQFPSSLEQSVISMDPALLGSPLQSCDGSLVGMHPMLAVSRLSHHSTMAQNVNHSHPIVIEWGKAYDSIIKFKESLIAVLSEHQHRIPQLASSVDELRSMELHSLDQKQDIQGQITEMRFGLALLLHQIEQTLQESFGQMLDEIEACDKHRQQPSPRGGKELETVVAHLTTQMKQNEANHRVEVEKNKDTIAQLSNRLENMKIQVAQLRRAPQSQVNREGIIMFTRLDSDRNTKALQNALERKRISSATLSQLTSSMDKYLNIPGQRLAVLSQRYHERTEAVKLVRQVQRSCPDPSQAMSIMRGLATREKRRQKEFSSTMSRLGTRRSELAHTLTDSLSHIEKQTKTFLIKPIFSRPYLRSPELITPLSRPLPVSQCHSVLPSASEARSRPYTSIGCHSVLPSASEAHSRPYTSIGCRPSTSNVRQIQTYLQSQRQQVDPQDLINSVNAAASPSKIVSGSPIPRIGSSKYSCSSLSTHHFSPTPSPASGTTTGVWNASSSVMDKEEGKDRNLQPSFSKMLELDISRHRQPDKLLGHMLPNLHHQHGSRRPTPSPVKLIALPEESPHSSPGSSQRGMDSGWERSLTPIDVSLRTNTLAVV